MAVTLLGTILETGKDQVHVQLRGIASDLGHTTKQGFGITTFEGVENAEAGPS